MSQIDYDVLAKKIQEIADWRYLPSDVIGRKVGVTARSLQRYMFQMRERGMLPAPSKMKPETYKNYLKLKNYMATHPGKLNLTEMVESIIGCYTSGSNMDSYRNAITQAKAECLPLDFDRIEDVKRARIKPAGGAKWRSDGKIRFIDWAQVDPIHLHAFVALIKHTGGRHAA
ncbi:hypothetical protein [Aeromonas hydrophila]|nr:hypothetical protein [Aeromonas hydrophila]MBC8670832.1 hypothetical protein [Aeromonas hydrophila]MBC8686517.1 hypothetical protein [Aeromonas hydrophila]